MDVYFHKHFGSDPDFNMAYDELLLGRLVSGEQAVHVRLYSWQPGAITIGFHQDIEKAIASESLGDTIVLRRFTGGRALYHDSSELTYSVVWDTCDSIPALVGTRSHGSSVIAEILQSVLVSFDYAAEIKRNSSVRNSRPQFFHSAPCFASHARHEITDGHKKLVASAARQIGTSVLQHGSIKLSGLATHPALPMPPESTRESTSTLRPLDRQDFDNVAIAFSNEVCSHLGVSLTDASSPEDLSKSSFGHLQASLAYLRKNRLQQRDCIKQMPLCGSL